MVIDGLSEQDCRAVLERVPLARLGCALENQPYVVPIYFVYEGDYLYVFSTFGQKIEWMRENPKVCIQSDEIKSESDWLSVVVNGRYEELPQPQYAAELAHAKTLLAKRYHWWANALAERRIKVGDSSIEPIFFRIRIGSITGLRATKE
jgi:nitroimidazol reductase NimA-like FMN-containing flavoprotein (pyridoxamine 5'-phosphate oxidase superfamily)